MFFSPRFQFLARNISLACAKNVNARSILVDSPPNDPDNKNNATTAPRSLEEEGNIEKHQRSLPPSIVSNFSLPGAASLRSLTAAIFSHPPQVSQGGGHEEATFPRAREPRVAQLYGFPGHKTSRIRETLVCRGAKPFATNFLASPSCPRASFTISSFLATNLRGGQRSNQRSDSRKKRRNVQDSFVVSKCSAREEES